MATIDEFKAQLIAGGVRGNRFSVYIPRMGENIEFMCKSAAIPGSTLPAIEVPFRAVSYTHLTLPTIYSV